MDNALAEKKQKITLDIECGSSVLTQTPFVKSVQVTFVSNLKPVLIIYAII